MGTVGGRIRESVEIEVAGEVIALLPARAAYWEREGILLVADVHLAKGEALAAHGLPLPGGVRCAELGRLTNVVRTSGASRLLVLGDFLHGPAGHTPDLVEDIAAWTAAIGVPVSIVTGNHDRGLERLAPRLRVEVVGARLTIGPFDFVHSPADATPGRYTWCGHVHPALRLSGGREPLRLACFHVGRDYAILPAFGLLTGLASVRVGAGERAFAIADGRVFEFAGQGP